jgi:hypothetical protein
MNFAKSVVLAAIAACAVACGGAPEEQEGTPETLPPGAELVTSEQRICEGYAPGAVCTVNCSGGGWFFINGVAYGQCESAGAAACGFTPYGACWSR